jgi:hypothetical protein
VVALAQPMADNIYMLSPWEELIGDPSSPLRSFLGFGSAAKELHSLDRERERAARFSQRAALTQPVLPLPPRPLAAAPSASSSSSSSAAAAAAAAAAAFALLLQKHKALVPKSLLSSF